jgi:hypothetical protein
MTFEVALKAVKCGVSIKRTSWNKKTVTLSKGDILMGNFLFMTNAAGDTMPWTPNQADLFANDWELVSLV